jgi:hypothetical protein
MQMIISSALAVVIGTGAALAFPTDKVPTSEPAYLAKVKTAAPEQIVAKASHCYDAGWQIALSSNWHQWLHLSD